MIKYGKKQTAVLGMMMAGSILMNGCGLIQNSVHSDKNTPKGVQDVLDEQTATQSTEPAATEQDTTNYGYGDVTNVDKPTGDFEITTKDGVLDITDMSSEMVYAIVYNMVTDPDQFVDLPVKIDGGMSVYEDPHTKKTYYACLVYDAAGCCAEGIEFVLADGDYPKEGTQITVTGTFTTYNEGDKQYIQLKDATVTTNAEQ
ncbi:hypothetical protein [Agathobacter ruminis]|uniref:Uncharacterized protein n=1 Tax=Agathobacter ruminis TaxID=1712665 RepID=A0A2G3E457_9FIRM|nr:hypothetical protein [Agathobacter ruminis]MDC7301766.1 hypothetical protein [Agathobacter ruminis]PHU37981.1 hypothetical protein CSX02_05205 [Agathobacter ruminis]